ncbi:undecaprenol kinase, putative [Hahella chejuensis KCTC 2396]|uniref:Undecaprenyl-diphosphatase n=1 Tax=Hahella chejuensis (strain KCTC 2396) TaxID=349521 RepID=UPPP_HAHCH|nr:undecaprenyl-diphosphate phosphatase [Hahella chejuensis]Q2SL19.1 RecName: Full=Undecaprenyl-diphosphatase; AltName: Full=Bacitracin resistance protein; AltName: Full=Undecaprenyl pyrophosphate phosphatase [Hahella chejuensis KCTC 2396]ABC28655.1 undecaprenol kinase, putative [Hahella chejuensis KCTC 2396]
MTWLEIVVLALIQGLTEFLPISSSAHLILPSEVWGWQDQGLAFDVAVHVGTLLAVMVYFRADIFNLLNGWIKQITGGGASQESRLAWAVILGTIPACVAGLLLDSWIEENLRSALVIALTTIGFGVLLGMADRKEGTRDIDQFTLKDALIIGVSQALALIPGTSRSGITMTSALFLGLNRDTAARFSFLLSIPLIAAAGLFKGLELADTGTSSQWSEIAGATLISAVSAYACIHLFLKFLQKIGFMPFVIYRMLLGAGLLVWLYVA